MPHGPTLERLNAAPPVTVGRVSQMFRISASASLTGANRNFQKTLADSRWARETVCESRRP